MMWLKNFLRGSPDRISLADEDISELAAWSIDIAKRREDLLPIWCRSNMSCILAWYGITVMVSLKQRNVKPPLTEETLDILEVEIGEAAMTSLFGEQANDTDLNDLRPSLFQTTRLYITMWLSAFENVEASRYFHDQEILAEMLASLVRNPEYALEDAFAIDDDSREEWSSAFATHIVACDENLKN